MVLKDDWETGDPFSADDANDVATQVNANTTAIAGKPDDLADLGVTASASELNILDGATLSTTELNYVDGVTSAIQTQLDGKVDENPSITGATKTKITYDSKGLVTAGADATTADIADSTNKRYVTDAQLTVIGNTSGTNTGDQTTVSGNAGSATVLQTARNIQTNLASTSAASFNGSANVTPGVTGTLAVGNGGTGATTLTGIVKGNGTAAFTAATAGTDYVAPGGALGTPSSGTLTNCTFPTLNQNTTGSAATLTTGRTFQTNLASTSAVSFNGSADVTPGVTGTLGIGNGGTGATTAAGIRSAINVADGATANSSDATLLNRANHTGTQAASTISDGVRHVVVSTGSESRPTTTGPVLWIGGDTEPTNYDDSVDIWFQVD